MIIVNQSTTIDFFIRGAWYTNTTVVNIPGITVNSVTVITDNELRVNITTPAIDGFFDVEVVTDEGGNSNVFTNAIEVKLSTWIDLRQDGDTFATNDIRVRAGMTINRDADGMFFTGNNPWSSWVKFESLGWQRGQNLTCEWIFTSPLSFMMIGIGSTATNEASTSQWNQGETLAYFNSATNFWGLFGNNGTLGSAGNQSIQQPITQNTVLKIKFESDGTTGGVFTLYQIPSANPSDWDDESNVLRSFTIGGTLNPDEVDIMPFIIPRTDNQRFIALKVE